MESRTTGDSDYISKTFLGRAQISLGTVHLIILHERGRSELICFEEQTKDARKNAL